MPDLTAADKKYFAQRLSERRAALRQLLAAALRETRREEYAELASQVHDMGDDSVSDLLIDVDFAGYEREAQELRDIEMALARLHGDNFGVCIDCGGDIGRDRLKAYLTAKRCLSCQQRRDLQRTSNSDISPSL